ncbi:uncharacterized protein LOC9302265 [Arabidopsis lyrata subsp. lyrata]|uniref:uncharacterized protein LOC9302265 n=1 Tax=Arabidopsis lyrata subsp. lyrata TaxID=81972 RepID=UPI000A29C352|nr:uncharacterized protein LOC9302265 [Arabidopsis lyrata subsp. lyrata]|eukprot:XP_020871680.1 uncharacterized protein LOC9302265 [Arabidopsis lyrata subsp. lyrata]
MLAMKLKGEKMRGKPVYLTRWSSSLFTACVVGFDPTLSDNDLKQRFSEALGSIGTADKPESVGILIKTFIPRSTSNGASLGFCYLYIQTDDKNEDQFKSCLERVDLNMGQISHVNLKHWVNEALLNALREGYRAWAAHCCWYS